VRTGHQKPSQNRWAHPLFSPRVKACSVSSTNDTSYDKIEQITRSAWPLPVHIPLSLSALDKSLDNSVALDAVALDNNVIGNSSHSHATLVPARSRVALRAQLRGAAGDERDVAWGHPCRRQARLRTGRAGIGPPQNRQSGDHIAQNHIAQPPFCYVILSWEWGARDAACPISTG